MVNELAKIFSRDLDKLKAELEAFKEEGHLWQTTGTIQNTAGNLSLHLVGNLKTYIGKNIGGLPYTRDREAEFNAKDVSRQELLRLVEETKQAVAEALQGMPEEKLGEFYRENVLGHKMTNAFFLIHLSAHLSYHLGQINYLRRALD